MEVAALTALNFVRAVRHTKMIAPLTPLRPAAKQTEHGLWL